MSRWGDRWLSGDEGEPVTFHYEMCGHDTHAEVVCAGCGKSLVSHEVSMRMGPGYPERLKQLPDVRRRYSNAI